MAVSVETLNGLGRKITVSVPTDKIEQEVGSRLKNLATKVKIDGFRPGKVPLNLVKQRYSESVRNEVARDMVQSTLFEALKEHELNPAGLPEVEPEEIISGQDFKYTATFEVYPEISVNELNQENVELISAEVQDTDVEKLLETLREQNKEWAEVERKSAKGDKLVIDFEGFVDNTAFEGGKAENFEVVIGSGSMIEGFEKGLIDAKPGESFDINVEFPADYGHADLAGKPARFAITVKKVFEGKLPEINEAFAEKFNVKEGGVDALKKDIKDNMVRELERRVSGMNRERAFDKLLEKNDFDLPKALIDQEIEHLKHEMYHRIFGNEHHENEKIPDFPRELFEDQAKKRVKLGLLFSEYLKHHKISLDQDRVNAMIDKFASAYENPDELRAWYKSNKDRMAEIEALVMEEMVADKILEDAKVVHKKMSYDEVVNPKQNPKDKEAE